MQMNARAVKLASKVYTPKKAVATAAGNIYIAHGLLGNAQNWATPAAKLADAPELDGKLHSVVSLDMRNHGESPHSPVHTNAALASDIESVVLGNQEALHRKVAPAGDRHADFEKVTGKNSILLGHSMGGFAVMGSLLRRYNEVALLPEDPFETTDGYGKKFGSSWSTERRQTTSAAMRSVNEYFRFAATQPIRDVLFNDKNLSKQDHNITGAIAPRVPKVGRLSAAVIVDITPTEKLGQQKTGEDNVKQTLNRMGDVQLGNIKSLDDATKELVRVGMADKGMRDFVITNLLIDSTGAQPTKWRCNLDVLAQQYGAFQPSIINWFMDAAAEAKGKDFVVPNPCTLPVLFVFGENSPYNNPETRKAIPNFFPNAKQLEVSGAGHFVQYEKLKGFLEAVVPFIAEHM